MSLITLTEWAKRRYAKPHHPKTLLRWVRDARIFPRPQKHGRAYYVQPFAEYVDPNDHDKIAQLMYESEKAQQV